ncbi:uncharacterized protein SPPG_04263 [Spizellomyces punctatus DAOM BR117]|uniref:SH3 domain-containing protein n=1 Tax=Spizellomyces punctatus (strain DAOM BR117) TaxID=645134 RepID=A0A0L0HJ92_SPIPD|nr:uncharacterized protein SPPG_04263 [Spizellomyces punctatus DAOM BR117]KND01172.1 hypothetical protein SPPG_04263 [Spizellomyces punctatus DAOM BR117]|eukprot:XP_016609211.1 hypothetical protein SPPG_04263 [Spizellomyces punctatus DAOM BR117]
MRAKALYDCVGDSVDELTFNLGDLIVDVEPAEDDGWYRGRLNGRIGIFPGNYVQLEEQTEETPVPNRPPFPARNTSPAPIRSLPHSSSTGSISSLGGRPSVGGLRRDTSASSLASLSDAGSEGFKVQLRPTAKPPDFAAGAIKTEDNMSHADEQSGATARAKKLKNTYTTRQALMEKSDAMAKAGRDSINARKSSMSEEGGSGPSPAGSLAEVMTRSMSGSSLGSNDGGGSVSQLRSKFANLTTEDEKGEDVSGFPMVGKRPPLLVSNQSSQPPSVPSRNNAATESDASRSPSVGMRSSLQQSNQQYTPPQLPSRGSTPNQSRNITPTPPTRALKPSEMRESQQDNGVEPVRLVKPSDLRAQSTAWNTNSTSLRQPVSGPTLPTRPAPSRGSEGPPLPARPGAGTALGLPKAIDASAAPINAPAAIPSRPAPPRPNFPSTIPSRPTTGVKAVIEPTARQGANGTGGGISPDALARYGELFDQTDTDGDGLIDGEQARSLWLRSGLDNRSLGLIWNLSDLDDDGMLCRREFCIGMFLIDERLRGSAIPESLSAELITSINPF